MLILCLLLNILANGVVDAFYSADAYLDEGQTDYLHRQFKQYCAGAYVVVNKAERWQSPVECT